MKRIKRTLNLGLALLLSLSLLSGCAAGGNTAPASPQVQQTESGSDTIVLNATASGAAGTEAESAAETVEALTDSGFDLAFSNRDLDASYDSAVSIDLDAMQGEGAGLSIEGSLITISAGGSYIFTGSAEARILVDAGEQDKVQLIFNGAHLSCADFAPLYIREADKVFLTLAEGSENSLADGAAYGSYESDASLSTVDGAIFSRADFTINGSGSLTVTGSSAHGIVSKDDLVVVDAGLSVSAVKSGLVGKDCVKIGGSAQIAVEAGADGIKSDNTEDTSRGFVYIADGLINITAGFDGIQAETLLCIAGGSLSITTGGGSANASTGSTAGSWGSWGMWGGPGSMDSSASAESSDSAKGLKCTDTLSILSGDITVDSSDDCLHSDNVMEIRGGSLILSSGDDGMHANDTLSISGGDILITKSYEGIEAETILVSGGSIDLSASDDGFNAAGGNDGSSLDRMGGGMFGGDGVGSLSFTGGVILVNAGGDGLDSNGTLEVSGGIILVSGPTDSANGALDYGSSATVTGGYLMALGSSGMAVNFGSGSTQGSILANFNTQQGGTRLSLVDESGNVLLSWAPEKAYSSAVLSAPGIEQGASYSLLAGGSAEEADAQGFACSGSLTGGESLASITMDSLLYGSGGMMGGGMMGGRGNRR